MTGLYVHVPFCARVCPYCDFDVSVCRAPDPGALLDGLEREYVARADELPDLPYDTLYVGGGTPSLLPLEGLRDVLHWARRRFLGDATRESTVEINPEHASPALFDVLRASGVDRVSAGVQTFSAGGLRELGRAHDPATAVAAVRAAAGAGLHVSVDLIVGWSGQDRSDVEHDVDTAVDAGATHLSVYALAVEDGAQWQHLVRRGLRCLPCDDHQASRLLDAERAASARGLVHYEVANYAVPGAEGLHNLGYWTWHDYVGVGPSAHSATFDASGSVRRRGNARGFGRWRADPGTPAIVENLGREAAAIEGLWTGLRRLDGIHVPGYLASFGGVSRSWLETRVSRQVARGNLRWGRDGEQIAVARDRWLWHDGICADLMEPVRP